MKIDDITNAPNPDWPNIIDDDFINDTFYGEEYIIDEVIQHKGVDESQEWPDDWPELIN